MTNHLTMEKHIVNVYKNILFDIRKIGAISYLLNETATTQLVHSLVTSRLDYCNSTLLGLPQFQIKRLQKIQNIAAKIVLQQRKFDHVTPLLRSLHWLPINQRIVYKVLVIVFKWLHNKAPQYLQDLITLYKPSRTLRSSDSKMLLVTTKSRTVGYGNRAFYFKAPSLWNKLPEKLRCEKSFIKFKNLLKTHLFREAYG